MALEEATKQAAEQGISAEPVREEPVKQIHVRMRLSLSPGLKNNAETERLRVSVNGSLVGTLALPPISGPYSVERYIFITPLLRPGQNQVHVQGAMVGLFGPKRCTWAYVELSENGNIFTMKEYRPAGPGLLPIDDCVTFEF